MALHPELDALVDYRPGFFSPCAASDLRRQLKKEIVYLDPEVTAVSVYGKRHLLPRRVAGYGDSNVEYSYSGSKVAAASRINITFRRLR